MERGCGIVRIDEAQFYFADVNLRADVSGLSLVSTGLVSVVAGLALISTGTSTGSTSLSVEQAWPAAKSATPVLHKASDQLGAALRMHGRDT